MCIGASTNTTGVFSSVAPGTYSVTARNSCGTSTPLSGVVVNAAPSAPSQPVASVTSQPSCATPTGTITITSPAPAGGLTYSIDGVSYTNTTGVFSSVAPGTYSVTARNSCGTSTPLSGVVVNAAPSAPSQPVASVTSQPSCATPTGTITITSPAPAGGLTYSIDGVTYTNTTGVFSSVSPGTYTVTARNSCGTSTPLSGVVVNAAPSAPSQPVASVTSQPSCATPTGTITITSPAPAGGLTYSIDGVTYTNTTGVFSSVSPGTYSVTARNSCGTSTPLSGVVVNAAPSAPSQPVASVTSQPSCATPTGTITITSPAPAGGLTYSIEGVTYTNTTGVFSSVAPGTYSVTARNSCGTSTPLTGVVVNAAPSAPSQPVASMTSQPSCATPTGTITITSPAPAGGLTYSIDGVTYTYIIWAFSCVPQRQYSVIARY